MRQNLKGCSAPISGWERWPPTQRSWLPSQPLHTQLWTIPVYVEGLGPNILTEPHDLQAEMRFWGCQTRHPTVQNCALWSCWWILNRIDDKEQPWWSENKLNFVLRMQMHSYYSTLFIETVKLLQVSPTLHTLAATPPSPQPQREGLKDHSHKRSPEPQNTCRPENPTHTNPLWTLKV